MSIHAYPRRAVLADLAGALLGITVAALPLALVPTAPPVTALLAALLAVFAALAVQTSLLLFTRIEVDADGVRACAPLDRALPWRQLRRVKLAYYSTRRDRSAGWLRLTLIGERCRLCIDSRLDGFVRIAALAAAASRTNRLPLDTATASNFQAIGLAAGDGPAAEARR